jgi:threonine dehydrogenase-like Zn-dependent dehydrogenase
VTEQVSLVLTAPRSFEIQGQSLGNPGPGLVLIQAEMSAINAAHELLVYGGELCQQMTPEIQSVLGFPTKTGNAMVGRVLETGPGVAPNWKGKRVFSFHPHESHFLAQTRDLLLLPEEVEPSAGVFVPQLETAVTLLQDGRPLIGEKVAVFGQSAVGLVTLALLRRFPLAEVVSCDPSPARRALSLEWGAQRTLAPESLEDLRNCDLTYELSGQPSTLGQAIQVTGFSGRVVIGSWYHSKRADGELGSAFQRSRIHILSSQGGGIDPPLSGSWTRERRMLVAIGLLSEVHPERLITHRFALKDASQAFELLEQSLDGAIQAVFVY